MAGALILLACACAKTNPVHVLIENERPQIHLTTAPLSGDSVYYSVRFTWFAFDPDGRVTSFEYAVDPPAQGDTSWQRTADGGVTIPFRAVDPSSGFPPASRSYHFFVIRAVDNEGARSALEFDAFTAYTVAPKTQILFPSPSHQVAAITTSTVTIRWRGEDPDGASRKTPVEFKFRLVSRAQIQNDLGIGSVTPSSADLQRYFSQEAPAFASWDSVPPDSVFARFENVPIGQIYYFAVVAFDEAGAYEPLFDLDRNVLQFKPSTELQGPRLTVFNDFLLYTQATTTTDVSEARIVRAAVTSGEGVRFNWSAEPTPGTSIAAYRWVLDPVNGDITDETPRQSDDQTYRWSGWSLTEKSALLGPFAATPELDDLHRLYIEARDDAGNKARVGIEIRAVARSRSVLVIDDYFANPDRAYGPSDPRSYQPFGNFPTEAVLDTLMFAVGNVPYRYRPPGTLSAPGVFAGFDYDTLDYRFLIPRGIPLEILLRYRVVVWFTSIQDAFRAPGVNPEPLSALRYACSGFGLNPLAAYLAHGGRVWLFGNGVTSAILLGENGKLINTPPSTSFLYQFLEARSRIDRSGSDPFGGDVSDREVPYLPASATPGRPWPPDSTRLISRGTCDDPRVGPGAERVEARWAGLPCLHMTTEFQNWPTGIPSSIACAYISRPLSIPGDPSTSVDGVIEPALDTLYLYRAMTYNASPGFKNSDGKPVMLSYWGAEHGAVVWTDLPLWMFERTELRLVAQEVLRNFGIVPESNPRNWTGPGSANAIYDAEHPGATSGNW